MATRKRQFAQMELPFDKAELRKPVRFTVAGADSGSQPRPAQQVAGVATGNSPQPYLPPGLRELAEAEKLNDNQVRQLAESYYTIRGGKPKTLAEWYPLYNAVKKYLRDDYGNHE